MTPTDSDLVLLRDGPAVTAAVLRCLWALEERGATFAVEGGAILVRPKGLLTDADRAVLRRHRDEVLGVLRYCDTYEPRHLQ